MSTDAPDLAPPPAGPTHRPRWTLARATGVLGVACAFGWLGILGAGAFTSQSSVQLLLFMSQPWTSDVAFGWIVMAWVNDLLAAAVLIGSIGLLLHRPWARRATSLFAAVNIGVLAVVTLAYVFGGEEDVLESGVIIVIFPSARVATLAVLLVLCHMPGMKAELAAAASVSGGSRGRA